MPAAKLGRLDEAADAYLAGIGARSRTATRDSRTTLNRPWKRCSVVGTIADECEAVACLRSGEERLDRVEVEDRSVSGDQA